MCSGSCASTAEALEQLYKKRFSGEFLGKQVIFVDEENYTIRLGFIGLSEVFRAHCSGPWTNDNVRPDWLDDVYHLAQCFKDYLSDAPEDVRSCLAEDKTKRPEYRKLLRAMAKDIQFRPHSENEISLSFNSKRTDEDEAKKLVEDLNLNDCYISTWEQEEGQKRRKCDFQTREHKGVFLNDEGDYYYYVERFSRKKSSDPLGIEILRARFKYVKNPVRNTRGGDYHHLATLGDQKSNKIQEWRAVPKAEKEFIEESAFEAKYCHVYPVGRLIKKFAFIISENKKIKWEKINDLKRKKKYLDAVPMSVNRYGLKQKKVGVFDDFTEGRLIVYAEFDDDIDIKSDEGELLIDGDIFVPFEFHWRRGRTTCFAAPVDFKNKQKLKEFEEIRQDNKQITVTVRGQLGVGNFCGEKTLSEIITYDAEISIERIPSFGVLLEDFHDEIIPFKRQIEAVNKFAQRDKMINPSLSAILTTPSEHQPVVIPAPEEHDFFNEELSDTQKEAVHRALFQKPLFLIQGPPGTGKTTVIVEIIQQILDERSQARILICSQTNLAVDNVIERLPKKKPIRKIRLASDQEKITKKACPYWFNERFKKWKNTICRSKQADGKVRKQNFKKQI